MTQFNHALSLSDGQCVAVEAAIKRYLEYCKQHEDEVPFGSHAYYLEELLEQFDGLICQNTCNPPPRRW